MFLLLLQLTALAADPLPDQTAVTTEPAAAEQAPDAPTTKNTAPDSPTLEQALATQVMPGEPWTASLETTVSALGEPTSQHGEMRCWLFERTDTSCSYWHLTAGTTADLHPGGDETPVVRFVGAGRASGSTSLPPCCTVQ